jgi:hypothetical protein
MVFYISPSGKVIHEAHAYYYKGNYYDYPEAKTEAAKDNINLKEWGT